MGTRAFGLLIFIVVVYSAWMIGRGEENFFLSYGLGPLSVSIDGSQNIEFAVTGRVQIPTPIGSVTAGYRDNPAGFYQLPKVLIIRVDDTDYFYDLHGQNVDISFESEYYRLVQVRERGGNLLVIVQEDTVGSFASPQDANGFGRFSCSGAYGPSFQIGDRFYIPPGDGPTSVWEEPNNVPRVGLIPENGGGIILGGPVCKRGQQGNLVTWMILSDNGVEGWVAEGYPDSPVRWIAPE